MKKTIQKLLDDQIQKIIDKNYENDSCKPKFVTSQKVDREYEYLITLTHLGTSVSHSIGFDQEIEDVITSLYNYTM